MDTLFEDEYDRTKIVRTLPADLDVYRIGGGADGACAALAACRFINNQH